MGFICFKIRDFWSKSGQHIADLSARRFFSLLKSFVNLITFKCLPAWNMTVLFFTSVLTKLRHSPSPRASPTGTCPWCPRKHFSSTYHSLPTPIISISRSQHLRRPHPPLTDPSTKPQTSVRITVADFTLQFFNKYKKSFSLFTRQTCNRFLLNFSFWNNLRE